ncbi:MAG: helix-hairpin-helix domain-containing protein [candidate division WOR-3 bacterium]|nr:helix-hairpin-helix domain-containing protein [candidate division WOR-3 bacterium]MCX7837541.1 helix-hairpin-helix domain-containing protein [candidate division WOR-3 bacterium]MDW8113645.1 helix-hairpin-helix domain-containing protein [candidate division WOR-3 bacterium]
MNEKEKIVLSFLSIFFILGSLLSLFNKKKENKFKDFPKNNSIQQILVTNSPIERNFHLININEASKEELMSLPGIGEKIAQRIVEYREKIGRFKNKDELLKIKGIGKKKLAKIENLIEIK